MPKDVKILLLLVFAFIVSACTVLVVGKAHSVSLDTEHDIDTDSVQLIEYNTNKQKK